MLTTIQKTHTARASPLVNGVIQRYELPHLQQLRTSSGISQNSKSTTCSDVHQIEIIADSDTDPALRCPYCRCPHAQLLCTNCIYTNVFRIGNVREERRRLESCRSAVCHLIETALIDEVKFETSFHQLRRSIEELRTKIVWKRDQIGQLKQRIASTESHGDRNRRNVVLLEKKMISHSERINRTHVKNADLRSLLAKTKLRLNGQIAHIARHLFSIFRLARQQLDSNESTRQAWTVPKRKNVYLLNDWLCLDRASVLGCAFPPPSTGGSPSSSPPVQRSFPAESLAALCCSAQFVELLAVVLHFPLPYASLHRGISLLSTNELAMRRQLFHLDYSILHLCLARGVAQEECELTEPLGNLYSLVQLVNKGMINECAPRLDQRIHRQVFEHFGAVQPDGRVLSEFTLDNVENDWVKVHCSN